ncbi:MAG: DUF3626 domain-containing protein [Minicystis sp.]
MSDAEDRALAFVRSRAERARDRQRATLSALLDRAGPCDEATLSAALRRRARVALSFHPDRPLADGSTVAERLLREGRYRGQFETGISSGSRTAFPGGDRQRWESKLFGNAYDQGASSDERPKYGALDLFHHADGPSPRFGSCRLVLRDHLLDRATLTWGDSHLDPEHVGTMEVIAPLLFALLSAVETKREALGRTDLDLPTIARQILTPPSSLPLAAHPLGRALDDYIEVQIHAPIALAEDVASLVIDPAFDGTPTGEALDRLAQRYALPLERHPGFVLDSREIHGDFRGPRMPALAERLDQNFASIPGRLDAAVIGRAACSLHDHPDHWTDWDIPEETLQHLKQLWHVLVRFGRARLDGP